METQLHLDNESENSASAHRASADPFHLAYGRKIKELLRQSDAETWIQDLLGYLAGFTLFCQEAEDDPRGHTRFVSFKELAAFSQDVGKMKLCVSIDASRRWLLPVYFPELFAENLSILRE